MVKVPPWQCPSSAPVPPQGAPGGSGQLETPRREAGPLGAQPLPRVLELAASKVADSTAFGHLHPGVLIIIRPSADGVSPWSLCALAAVLTMATRDLGTP